MRSHLVLILHSITRIRTLVLVMALVLAIFQVFLIVIGRSIEQSNTFEQMGALIPPFVRQLLGPSFSSFMSFRGMVSLGYFHLAIIGSLVGLAISLATMPTSEVEMGFMDLILSRPVARRWIITRTIILLALGLVLVLAMMMLGTWAGLNFLVPNRGTWPSAALIGSVDLNV